MFICTTQQCYFCQQGSIGIRATNDNQHIFAMCDECETLWLNPLNVAKDNSTFVSGPDFLIPEFSISLLMSHWATMTEIMNHNLQNVIAGENESLEDIIISQSKRKRRMRNKQD